MVPEQSEAVSAEAIQAARAAFIHARQQVEYFGASDTDADPIPDALAAAYPIIEAEIIARYRLDNCDTCRRDERRKIAEALRTRKDAQGRVYEGHAQAALYVERGGRA